jgi:hypothetical protein
VLVDHVPFKGRQQEPAKPPARRVGGLNVLPLQKAREEALREVLRLLAIVAAAAQVA